MEYATHSKHIHYTHTLHTIHAQTLTICSDPGCVEIKALSSTYRSTALSSIMVLIIESPKSISTALLSASLTCTSEVEQMNEVRLSLKPILI